MIELPPTSARENVSREPGGEAHGLKRSKEGNSGSWRGLIVEFGSYFRSGAAMNPLRAAAMIAAVLATTGCLHRPSAETIDPLMFTGASPRPTPAHVTRAWREAEAYIADRAGAEIMVGCGDSMFPLYRSRTLLVTERQPYEDWRPGQTVVFRGQRGWPVAHLLVVKSRAGWRSAGLARAEFDPVLVTPRNYLGTVTKAYELVPLGTSPDATVTTGTNDLRTAANF